MPHNIQIQLNIRIQHNVHLDPSHINNILDKFQIIHLNIQLHNNHIHNIHQDHSHTLKHILKHILKDILNRLFNHIHHKDKPHLIL